MNIFSTEFEDGGDIPTKYTCDGKNINPPLSIVDVPKDAESLLLIMDDPDAPSGTFVHWVLSNIHPSTVEIPEDSVPDDAVQSLTSFGTIGYGGPCPHSGTHRYVFRLYALDEQMSFSEDDEAEDIEEAIENHILEQVELTGRYGRQAK